MSPLDALPVRRLVTRTETYRDSGDLLVLTDDRPAPDGARVYRVVRAGDIGALIAGMFGNSISGLSLADTAFDLSGLSPSQTTECMDAIRATAQQWGNCTLDGAHGLANAIQNAPLLLDAPRVHKPITAIPAIAVGGGPSTTALMDAIRESGCLIVACDTALKPLQNAGITAHACTPLERLRSTTDKLPVSAGPTVYCGTVWAPPSAVNRFAKHTFWPTTDPVMDWLGVSDSDFDTGTTTGTCAAAVALRLTSGPVYLVGHDLCGNHMDGADISAKFASGFDAERIGHDGQMHPTKTAWLRAKFDLEGMDTGRLINAGGHAGYGLVLDGVATGCLPTWVSGGIQWPTERGNRLMDFLARARYLWLDLEVAATRAQIVTDISDMGLERLCDPRNLDAVAYVLRPLYAQCSLERRLGRAPDTILRTFKEAIANISDTIGGALRHAGD